MKSSIPKILIFLILLSCSTFEKKENKEKGVIGHWEAEDINIGFIHANTKFPKINLEEVDKSLINSEFTIEFNRDLTFIIRNKDGSIDSGAYALSGKSLLLRKSSFDWLNLDIIEQTPTTMDLEAKIIRFYSLEKDSIHFFTGDKVKIKLKKFPRTKPKVH